MGAEAGFMSSSLYSRSWRSSEESAKADAEDGGASSAEIREDDIKA